MGKHIGVRDSRVDELLISSMWNASSPPQGCICITNETAVTGLNSKLELYLVSDTYSEDSSCILKHISTISPDRGKDHVFTQHQAKTPASYKEKLHE